MEFVKKHIKDVAISAGISALVSSITNHFSGTEEVKEEKNYSGENINIIETAPAPATNIWFYIFLFMCALLLIIIAVNILICCLKKRNTRIQPFGTVTYRHDVV